MKNSIGTWIKAKRREMGFTQEQFSIYSDEEYLKGDNPKPVSLTLPLIKEPYISKTMFSFFDGLIPEGWLLAISEENWKVDRRDRMGLLLSVCADPIGSVSVRRAKE